MPIYGRALSHYHFQPLINRIMNKIIAWKWQVLSFAGRATLLQSIFLTFSLYIISFIYFPTSLVHLIKKELRAFLWDHPITHRDIHRIACNKICISKNSENLGYYFFI